MSIRTRALTSLMLLALAGGACSDATPPVSQDELAAALKRDRLPEPLVRQLLELRESLLPYESFEAAKLAGFDQELTPCMVMRPHGGMGFHYGNGLLIDGIPDESAPEVLLYEPHQGGKRLVGVEFIVPFTEWPGSEPPVLFGMPMRPNEGFGLWTLHVWLFKHNPQGVFADWNPRVNC